MQSFRRVLEVSVKLALADQSIDATVSGRVKTLDSLLKKLIRKPEHTYDSLSDKIGIRVITSETSGAAAVIRDRFVCLAEEDKSAGLGIDRLGYPGIHFDVELKPDDAAHAEYAGSGLRAEIQVRTYGQHAWCEVSHRFDYKNGPPDLVPQQLRRRLMLTTGLLEMADLNLREVATAVNDLQPFQLNRLLNSLEELYFRLTSRASDRELSISTLTILLRLYRDPDELLAQVRRFVTQKRDVIRQVFERNERMDTPRSAIFFQPEILVVWELLANNPDALWSAWVKHLPEDELKRLANEFGFSYEWE